MAHANPEDTKAYNKAYYEKNKEELNAKNKAYREKNKERLKAYREKNKEKIRAYTKKYKEKHYANQLKRLYGIGLHEYNLMLTEQKGKCACCGFLTAVS